MTIAIFGLVGVVIGGLLNGGLTLLLDERRERRRGLQAARVLDSELLSAETALDFFVVKRNTLWPDELVYPDGAVWLELRSVVALAVDAEGWITLNVGFQALDDVRVFRGAYRPKEKAEWDRPLDPNERSLFDSPLADIRKARQVLHPLAYPRLPNSLAERGL